MSAQIIHEGAELANTVAEQAKNVITNEVELFSFPFFAYPGQPYLGLYNEINIFRGYVLDEPIKEFPVKYTIVDPKKVIALNSKNYSEDLTILGIGDKEYLCVQLFQDPVGDLRISYYRWVSIGKSINQDGIIDRLEKGFPSRNANHLVTPENFENLKSPLLLCYEAFRLLDEQYQILAANCIPSGQ